MEGAGTKSTRLMQLEYLLLSHVEGLTCAEIARRLDVHRSTAGRYLTELTPLVSLLEEGGRFRIDRGAYLHHVRLTVHEAAALHLACRLMAARTDRHNPHAASAVRKLSVALEPFSRHVAACLAGSADAMDGPGQRRDAHYLAILETLILAWADGRMVRLVHFSARRQEASTYEFAPYFIEPYAVGLSIHAIGRCRGEDHLRTFKIERIKEAELLEERFKVEPAFAIEEHFRDAWGIWRTDAGPVRVILRFSPAVAQRVGETTWHRGQQLTPEPNGGLLWEAEIAEPLEMYPWIRGWGADVEILEPLDLRRRFMAEVEELRRLYGVQGGPGSDNEQPAEQFSSRQGTEGETNV